MEGVNKVISVISYNCEHADDIRLPFFHELFDMCDFLLLQEHALFQSKLPWLNAVGSDVGIHGVSAMDENKPLRGRPHGGAVILWSGSIGGLVTPVPWDSKRFCAVIYNNGESKMLIVCVYMPCDDWRPDANVVEYNDILNEIFTLINSVDVDCFCIGGDFNTDFSRNTYQTDSLKSFIDDNDLFCCSTSNVSDVRYTYLSKINGSKSFIDHFIVSENLRCKLSEFSSIDTVNNTSDHVAINCSLNFDISYNKLKPNKTHVNRPVWNLAEDFNIKVYMELLDKNLLNIPLPYELINCKDVKCKSHQKEICKFHDDIVNALVMACEHSIPSAKSKANKSRVVVGWNDHVEHYFRNALFWHKYWVDRGRPDDGVIANIRRDARALYHKIRKDVIKHQGMIQSDKISESLEDDSSQKFWDKVKKMRPNATKLPSSVDGVNCYSEISDLFKDKFYSLFNSVPYNNDDMNVLLGDIEQAVNIRLDFENDNDILWISPDLIRNGICKLKCGKNDGSLPLTSENFIHATDIFYGHLSLLFSAMLSHGCSPDGMLLGTMVPLPKGRFNDSSNSNNFRALTISSLLGKILDNIILNIESDNLLTNDLQFSFKSGSSTTMCTTMIRETISYFVNKGSNVYGLVLDATKAFDRINYCKLFRILLERNINPLICRLLLNMYTNQKLRVKWANELSVEFSVTNGVKQGGVISPLLFCVYMDGLIK